MFFDSETEMMIRDLLQNRGFAEQVGKTALKGKIDDEIAEIVKAVFEKNGYYFPRSY